VEGLMLLVVLIMLKEKCDKQSVYGSLKLVQNINAMHSKR